MTNTIASKSQRASFFSAETVFHITWIAFFLSIASLFLNGGNPLAYAFSYGSIVALLYASVFAITKRLHESRRSAALHLACAATCLLLAYSAAFHAHSLFSTRLESIYFSIVTWTTLGYGDLDPGDSALGRFTAASEAFFGYVYMGVAISFAVDYLKTRENGQANIAKELDVFDFGTLFTNPKKGSILRWLDTYCPRESEFSGDFQRAAEQCMEIRMLAIDPLCENSRFRQEELNDPRYDGDKWTTYLLAYFQELERILHSLEGSKFSARIYRDLPGVPFYLRHDPGRPPIGYFSIFLNEATAHEPHFQLAPGRLLEEMRSFFDAKWDRAGDNLTPATVRGIVDQLKAKQAL